MTKPNLEERKAVVLIAIPEDNQRNSALEAVRKHLPEGEVHGVVNSDEVVEAAALYDPDVVVLHTRLAGGAGFELVRQIQGRARTAGTILIAEEVGPEDFRKALQVGARDLLQTPLPQPELFAALDRALEDSRAIRNSWEQAKREEAGDEPAQGIVVFSTKGGTGKTFVAVNLAAGLALAGKRVALVDLDLQFGDSALALGLVPERTIYDLVHNYPEFDLDLLNSFLLPHASGIHVLPAPLFPDQAEDITADDISSILKVIEHGYDYVVVDSPPFFEDRILSALDWADTILHVGSLDLLSVKNMKVGFTMMNLMAYEKEKLKIVMNRSDSDVGLDIAAAERHLGVAIDHLIPSSVDVPRALNAGEVLLLSDPKSRVSHELNGIVRSFYSNGHLNGNGRKRHFKLFGKK